MNFNVLVFFLLLELNLSTAILLEEDRIINYFDVLSEPKEVERLAILHAESEEISKSKKTFFSKVTFIPKKKLCHYKRDFKILFCRTILQIDYYGLEFDVENYKQTSCKLNTFSVKNIQQKRLKHFQLSMFNCPDIFYIDLESNERRYLPYMYSISKGDKDDSLFVFFQPDPEGPVNPYKYVSNIAYKKIISANHNKEKTASPVIKSVPIHYTKSFERTLMEYLRKKQFFKSYRKFMHMFSTVNLCSLKRAHKIYLCRQNLSQFFGTSITLDVQGYEDKCTKHHVKFLTINEKNISLKNRKLISVLHCPFNTLNDDKILHYYLASSSYNDKVFLFSRTNEKGEKLGLHQYIVQPIETSAILLADIRRAEWILYPTEREKLDLMNFEKRSKIIGRELNIGKSNAQILATIPRNNIYVQFEVAKSSSLIDTRWLVEELLISFSKIKKNKMVYQKFSVMHRSKDIYQMREEQILELCKSSLTNVKYRIKIGHKYGNTRNDRCSQKKIRLISRECDKLETNSFTLCKCLLFELDTHIKYTYYVGKSHIRNTTFIFKSKHDDILTKYKPSIIIYPDAINIDMNLMPINQS